MTIIKLSKEHGKLLCDVPDCSNKEIITRENEEWIYPENWMELYLYSNLKNMCPECSDALFNFLNSKSEG